MCMHNYINVKLENRYECFLEYVDVKKSIRHVAKNVKMRSTGS
jgi:hypothetical protein